MLGTISRLLGIHAGKKQILLSVPAFYPIWHRRFGEETGFRESVTAGDKVHAIKRNIRFWQEMVDKYRSGKYRIVVCYMGDDPYHREYYPIVYTRHLDIQRACFGDGGSNSLLVEGKDIPVETVARNEGMDVHDLLEWRKVLGTQEFCIVHFTGFRY